MDFKKENISKNYNESYRAIKNKYYDYKDAMGLAIKELRLELKELMTNRYIGGHDNNIELIEYIQGALDSMNAEMKTMSDHINHHYRSLNKVRAGKDALARFENPKESFSINFTQDVITDKFSSKTWNAVMKAKKVFEGLKDALYDADIGYDLDAVKFLQNQKNIEVAQLSENISGFNDPAKGVSVSLSGMTQQASTARQHSCMGICRVNH